MNQTNFEAVYCPVCGEKLPESPGEIRRRIKVALPESTIKNLDQLCIETNRHRPAVVEEAIEKLYTSAGGYLRRNRYDYLLALRRYIRQPETVPLPRQEEAEPADTIVLQGVALEYRQQLATRDAMLKEREEVIETQTRIIENLRRKLRASERENEESGMFSACGAEADL